MRIRGYGVAVLAAALSLVTLVGPVGAAAQQPARPAAHTRPTPGPRPLLPRPAHGHQALRLLGDDLAAAADRNHLSVKRITSLLTQDPTVWLDEQAHLYYVDPPTAPESAPPETADAAPYPYAQTFTLHSKPWAKRTIYLDFDGAHVENTAWNSSDGLPAADYPGFSTDADFATFLDSERDTIQEVWARVAEDYAPFEVDVTTQDPGLDGLSRTSQGDDTWGMRVLFTESTSAYSAICNETCGGRAYLDVFGRSATPEQPERFAPAWVFAPAVGDTAAGMAEVASHETGHTLGLRHDGLFGSEYYVDGRWSPIMGAGYAALGQFSNGDYDGASEHQDDLKDVATHGTRLVSDDHGETPADATSMGPRVTATGVIGTRTDRDVFALSGCSGTVTVGAVPGPSSPNLDIALRLLDGSGGTLATASPATRTLGSYPNASASGLDARLTSPATGAPLYVEVDGVGQTGTGAADSPTYSDYGSVGPYTLSVTGCAGGLTAPGRPLDLDLAESPATQSETLTWQPPKLTGGSSVSGYVVHRDGVPDVRLPAGARRYTWPGLDGATDYTFSVRAENAQGPSPWTALSATTATYPPSEPRNLTVTTTGLPAGQARIGWSAPAHLNGNSSLVYWGVLASTGVASVDLYAGSSLSTDLVRLVDGREYTVTMWAEGDFNAKGTESTPLRFTYHRPKSAAPTGLSLTPHASGIMTLAWTPPSPTTGVDAIEIKRSGLDRYGDGPFIDSVAATASTYDLTDLVAGRSYTVTMTSQSSTLGPSDPVSVTAVYDPPVPPATAPSPPRIGTARSGRVGGAVTATGRWSAPTSTGGSAITGYRVTALRMSSSGAVLRRITASAGATARSRKMRLAKGRYRFTVTAVNAVGASRTSGRSNLVRAR